MKKVYLDPSSGKDLIGALVSDICNDEIGIIARRYLSDDSLYVEWADEKYDVPWIIDDFNPTNEDRIINILENLAEHHGFKMYFDWNEDVDIVVDTISNVLNNKNIAALTSSEKDELKKCGEYQHEKCNRILLPKGIALIRLNEMVDGSIVFCLEKSRVEYWKQTKFGLKYFSF